MSSPGPSVAASAPCVAAPDMGYGHLRAAAANAAALGTDVVRADRPPVASEREARLWDRARRWYEGLLRAAGRRGGRPAHWLLDRLTGIPVGFEDASRPDAAVRWLERLVGDGLGAGLVAQLREDGVPLVTTFYASAIAADRAGLGRVHCVATDSDLHRVWAPADAARSRIEYLVPTQTAAQRLVSYGVARERVDVAGFPLPPALAAASPAARIARLDPRGTFRAREAAALSAAFGGVPDAPPAPPTLVYAIGGAGAQTALARRILAGMRDEVLRDAWRVVLVAGVRERVAARLASDVRAERLDERVEVLHEPRVEDYLRRFDELLARADVLWTKPSELTFYAALGLPLVLCEPLGVHEERNRAWVSSLGAALDGTDVRATAAHLPRLLAEGRLAEIAWNGWRRMPRDGARRIAERVRGEPAPHV